MYSMSVVDSTDTDTAAADPEPIPLEATATLDYSTNPDRPVTVEAVTIRATVDDSGE